ncbi:MAG: FkbM family methyltransferase [Elusimicrobiota bacterium]|jgi:FkbM family methyltransferase
MKVLQIITRGVIGLARSLALDRWPVVGRRVKQLGRFWNAWVYSEGLSVLVDGQVSIRISPRIFSGGSYRFDEKLTREILSLAAPGRSFLDAGAHVGICSLLYAQMAGPGTRIAAFEPNPNVFPLLFENVRVNGLTIEIYRAALSDRVGEAVIHTDGIDPNASLSAEAPGKYWYWKDKAKPVMRPSRVPMTTLDAFCAAFTFDPGVIKLDVEGAERQVLLGAAQTLRRCRPWILLETHVFAWESFGYSRQDLTETIRQSGYEICGLDGQPFHGMLGDGPQEDNNHFILKPS